MPPDLTEDDKVVIVELLRETIERDRFPRSPRVKRLLGILAIVLAVVLTFGPVNFPARASEPAPDWKLEKTIDKFTAETSCQIFRENGPATLKIFQIMGQKNTIGAVISSYATFRITRFRIDSGPAQYAAPVGILFDYANTHKPTMSDLLNIKTISIEYENPADGKLDVIEFKVDHVQEAIEHLRERNCQ